MLYFTFNWKSYKLNEWQICGDLKLLVLSNRNKPLYSYCSYFVIIQLLMTNAGRLKDRKKTNKQTNRERNKQKARPLDFVVMGNEILAPDKRALVFPKMDSALHHINYYPEDNNY